MSDDTQRVTGIVAVANEPKNDQAFTKAGPAEFNAAGESAPEANLSQDKAYGAPPLGGWGVPGQDGLGGQALESGASDLGVDALKNAHQEGHKGLGLGSEGAPKAEPAGGGPLPPLPPMDNLDI